MATVASVTITISKIKIGGIYMARPVREELTTKQIQCISELIMKDITGKTNEQIAEEIGINLATLYRWRKNKLFNERLTAEAEELQKSYLADTYCQLRKIINNPKSAPAHKIKAIELFLKNQGRLKDVQENKVDVSVNADADEVLKRLGIVTENEEE